MDHSPDRNRAALLLTNRLVSLDVDPLTAREFWDLSQRVDLGDLIHLDVDGITALLGIAEQEALRLRTLLDAVTALSFEEERLLEGGVSLISALDDRFPAVLRERLGTTCPPFLLTAGPLEWAGQLGLGVVGSRDASEAALNAARESAAMAVRHGWPVISGLARGVDQVAMAAALDAGGAVIGVPAEGIITASRNAEIRRRVHQGELCIISPYAPTAPFRAGNAMGRNKIVYALSQVTFVVASDKDTGGTWAGAKEALDRRYTAVAVWAGDGAKDGNHALITRGAHPITDLTELFTLDTMVTGAEPIAETPLQTQLF
jgi:predicted Rossmann fold nucleotide-binding protein DprA/Smf involved in DNA uptake